MSSNLRQHLINLAKLQRLQNKVSPATGTFQSAHRRLARGFQVPYFYDFITKVSRHQAEVLQRHENEHVCNTVKAKPNTVYKDRFKLCSVNFSPFQMTTLPSNAVKWGMMCRTNMQHLSRGPRHSGLTNYNVHRGKCQKNELRCHIGHAERERERERRFKLMTST